MTGAGSASDRLRALGLALPRLGQGVVGRDVDVAGELLVQVLGENGRHARTAVGVAGLPRNSPIEIQMICTAV